VKRAGDLVVRYGGEEFAVILQNTHAPGAMEVGEIIRTHGQKLQIAHRKSIVSGSVTVSLGVSTVVPTNQFSSELLVAAADQALYQAKSQGRDRVLFEQLSPS